MITVEHLLYIGSIVDFESDKNILTELIRNLVPRSETLPTFIALLICIVHEHATFVWNFLDIFLMMVGIGLSMHFKVLNNELERTTNEIKVNRMRQLQPLLLLFYNFQFFRVHQVIFG